MSFGSSQLNQSQTSMKKLLLRRNASGPDDVQDDAPTDLPVVQESTNLPATSHKRKQSDALVLSELDISQADVKAAYYSSLSPIEQGTVADVEEDGTTTYYGSSGGERWKAPIRSFFSSCQLVAFFVILASVTTLHSVRSRRGRNAEDTTYYTLDDVTGGGSDEIGEPMEASYDEEWIEFFSNPDRMPLVKSVGPTPVHPKIGGMWRFENVCVTNNIDAPKPPELDTSLRGLLYFDVTVENSRRCVPCSKSQMSSRKGDRWDADSDSALGHGCGFSGLHAMFARSVPDYNLCMADPDNHKLMIRGRQNQSPSHVEQIHFWEDPTFLLNFDAHDRENALVKLMTYLPHWHKFKSDRRFPFESVISHSVQGCLSHSKNWLCEVLHHVDGLGYSKEVQWERKDSTLYCYKELYYSELGYQREHEGLLSKDIMDTFRNELFRSLALGSPRDSSAIREKDARVGIQRPINIALIANGRNTWEGLDKLVSKAKAKKKYHVVEFNLIKDNFDDLTVAEQANVFNLADAIVSSAGDHWANSIFSPDESYFAEVGCSTRQSLIGNEHYLHLLSGTYKSVRKCVEDRTADEICVTCTSDGTFSMTGDHFHALIDGLVKHQQENKSFERDSI